MRKHSSLLSRVQFGLLPCLWFRFRISFPIYSKRIFKGDSFSALQTGDANGGVMDGQKPGRSGDRHLSRARVYISGSQKRKIETEKKEKTQQVIQKNPKLTSFFQPLFSRSPGNITTESILHVAASQEQNEQGEDCESQVNTEGLLGVDTEQGSDQEVLAPTLITSKNQIIGGDDIGLWPPSATPEMIEYWTCQGEISDLRRSNGPFQKSNCARTGRSMYTSYVYQ